MLLLESLPPELLLAIVSSIDTTQELLLFIAASPRCLRVFSENRAKVLLAVLKRAIHPHAFDHALAAVNCPKAYIMPNQTKRRHVVIDFMEQYRRRDPAGVGRLSDRKDVSQLAKLHASVTQLINNYASDMIPILSACGCEGLSGSPYDDGLEDDWALAGERDFGKSQPVGSITAELSHTERARLEAAFYRYEIYNKLFRGPGHPHYCLPSKDHCKYFSSYLRRWEAEELACISQYLLCNITRFLNQASHRLIHEVHASAIDDPSVEVDVSVVNDDNLPGPFRNLDLADLWFHSFTWLDSRRALASDLVSTSLNFVAELLSSRTSTDRRLKLMGTMNSHSFFSITHALELARAQGSWLDSLTTLHTEAFNDEVQPNHFFLEYSKTAEFSESPMMSLSRHGLRATGYVFWDTTVATLRAAVTHPSACEPIMPSYSPTC
jgi:hypothetical protein